MILSVDVNDDRGPYLVRFEDGLQFRYNATEIDFLAADNTDDADGRIIRVIRIIRGYT